MNKSGTQSNGMDKRDDEHPAPNDTAYKRWSCLSQRSQAAVQIVSKPPRPWAKICKSSSRCNIVEAT